MGVKKRIFILGIMIGMAALSCLADFSYKFSEKGEPQGMIAGKLTPPGVDCIIIAEERGGVYGMMARTNKQGEFLLKNLPPGIYDLVIIPQLEMRDKNKIIQMTENAKYCVMAGQDIPKEYKGFAPENEVKAIEGILKKNLPEALSKAYLQKETQPQKVADCFSPDFQEDFSPAEKGGIPPTNFKKAFETGLTVSSFHQERSIFLLLGNESKASAISLVDENVSFPYYFMKKKEGDKIVSERVNEKKDQTNRFFELCFLEKRNGKWALTSRQLVKPRVFPFPHVSELIKKLQVKFYIEGKLLGITVSDQKTTDIGEIVLLEWGK